LRRGGAGADREGETQNLTLRVRERIGGRA
jgi:hypothetical protein